MKLYDNISKALSKRNINLSVDSMYDYMQIWQEWYSGDVTDFHHYNGVLVNGTTSQFERKTMNMAKKNCEDISKLLWTEKTTIDLSNKTATKKLWQVLDSKNNDFTTNFPIFLEKGLALGNGLLVEYKNSEGETIIDYIDGNLFIPYKYTNSHIYGLITVSTETVVDDKDNKKFYHHLTYHEYEKGTYTIKNELYESDSIEDLGKQIDFFGKYEGLKKIDKIETPAPYFQVFKPNLANNLNISSPLGISIFANSIDRYKALDTKYDSFTEDFILGKKRILVDSTALKAKPETTDGQTRYVQYFDVNERVFQGVAGTLNNSEPVKEIDFNLRSEEHINSINAELSWLSSNLGLGSNYYKFDGQSVKTAKEVMSENSEAFRTREHYLIVVKELVCDLVEAICHMEGIKTNSINVVLDDSIIEDKDTEMNSARLEVQQGLMSKHTYLSKYRGLTDEEIEEELQQINDEKMVNQEMFGFETNDKKKDEKKE